MQFQFQNWLTKYPWYLSSYSFPSLPIVPLDLGNSILLDFVKMICIKLKLKIGFFSLNSECSCGCHSLWLTDYHIVQQKSSKCLVNFDIENCNIVVNDSNPKWSECPGIVGWWQWKWKIIKLSFNWIDWYFMFGDLVLVTFY